MRHRVSLEPEGERTVQQIPHDAPFGTIRLMQVSNIFRIRWRLSSGMKLTYQTGLDPPTPSLPSRNVNPTLYKSAVLADYSDSRPRSENSLESLAN